MGTGKRREDRHPPPPLPRFFLGRGIKIGKGEVLTIYYYCHTLVTRHGVWIGIWMSSDEFSAVSKCMKYWYDIC
jgi:hypothetical protein